uniref:Uncharacterized protein n=1 Tax=Trichuris muris TaxID=70415 RepID=A0A5S6QCW0_TRIMR
MMANPQNPVVLGPGMRKLLSVNTGTDSSTEPITANVSDQGPPGMNDFGFIAFTIDRLSNTVDVVHSGNVGNRLLTELSKTALDHLSKSPAFAHVTANSVPRGVQESSKSSSVDRSTACSVPLASLKELDGTTGEASEILPTTSEITVDKDSSDCNLSIELGESDSPSTTSEGDANTDDMIACNGTPSARESEMDIVQGECREAGPATFQNVFNEILACTVHNDDSPVEELVPDKGPSETMFDDIRKEGSVEALVWALNFSCLACLSEVDVVPDEDEEPSDRSGGQTGRRSVRATRTTRRHDCIVKHKLPRNLRRAHAAYEDEMQTDVQSEEPSFRPHIHDEALTVEPHEDVMPKGSGPQRTDALETIDVRSPERADEAASEELKSMASEIPVQSNNEVICNDVQVTTGCANRRKRARRIRC